MYTIVEDFENKVIDVEDMVINVLREAYKLLPAKTVANLYIYDDASLTKEDVTPDMEVGIIKRSPHRKKIAKRWILAWTPTKLQEYSNEFQSVVKKREERRF